MAETKKTATFRKVKETKGTWVYEEEDEMTPAIGVLYVKKHAVAALGSPERLSITIQAAE